MLERRANQLYLLLQAFIIWEIFHSHWKIPGEIDVVNVCQNKHGASKSAVVLCHIIEQFHWTIRIRLYMHAYVR